MASRIQKRKEERTKENRSRHFSKPAVFVALKVAKRQKKPSWLFRVTDSKHIRISRISGINNLQQHKNQPEISNISSPFLLLLGENFLNCIVRVGGRRGRGGWKWPWRSDMQAGFVLNRPKYTYNLFNFFIYKNVSCFPWHFPKSGKVRMKTHSSFFTFLSI